MAFRFSKCLSIFLLRLGFGVGGDGFGGGFVVSVLLIVPVWAAASEAKGK